jgi:hypothetical protein
MNNSFVNGAICLALVIGLGIGCASTNRKDVETPLGIDEEPVNRVALVPLVRTTPAEVKFAIEDLVEKRLVAGLGRRGIEVLPAGGGAAAPAIDEEEMRGVTAERLRALGPESERFVLVVFLTDYSSRITFGSTCNAEVVGYLVDKHAGSVVWRGKGVGASGQGGLAGMMMKRLNDRGAVETAVAELIASFPKAVARA